MNAPLMDARGALCPAAEGVRPDDAGAGPRDELDDRRDAGVSEPGAFAPGGPLDKLIAGCARHVGRRLNPALTREDLMQEGRLAVLEALRTGRIPAEPGHRHSYILRRLLGAMQDANRAARAQQPDDVQELSEFTPGSASPNRPDRICELREAVQWLYRHAPAQVIESMELLAEGHEDARVGWMVGVSGARVCQRRRQAREMVAHCW